MINARKKKNIELNQKYFKGGYPDLNWELTVPHTAALPIELHPPFFLHNYFLITVTSETIAKRYVLRLGIKKINLSLLMLE